MIKEKYRFFVQTFGCQMNVNDSEKVEGLLRLRGYEPAESAEAADVVFINTCAVREKASAKLHHALARLRRVKRRRPDLRIAVGGCVAQLEGPSILDRSKHVDVLVGTHNFHRVPDLVEESFDAPGPLVDLDRKADAFAVPASSSRRQERGARLRHRDGGVQPRLQLLRRAADAGTRGEPPGRGDSGRGRVGGRARVSGGDAPRPDGQRVSSRLDGLRRPARARARG